MTTELEAETSKTIEVIISKRDTGPSSITAASLESQITEEKAQRRIERFFWIFLTTILADGYLAQNVNVWAFIFLNILIFVLLLGLANWMEVPWVVKHLEACLSWATKKNDPPSLNEP